MKKLLLFVFITLIAAGLTIPVYAQSTYPWPGYPVDEGYPVDYSVPDLPECSGPTYYDCTSSDKDRGGELVSVSIGEYVDSVNASEEYVESAVDTEQVPDVAAGGEGPGSAIVIVGLVVVLLFCCWLILKTNRRF